ncbi:MAG: hypothetical protein M1826_000721 [Phylliscum demangeonii]|nr:MAG: hypothetical protein M1826_000721 [Phylliscum demangeonii]
MVRSHLQSIAVQNAKPIALPPLKQLRVRRPNDLDSNPCLGVMSSVLSTLLGISRRDDVGVRVDRAAIAHLYGYKGM